MKLDDCYFNMPGRVVEFFPETQTATLRICVERNYSTSDIQGARQTRGLLQDVPVHVLSGGGYAITQPIAVGDSCIIFFSQIGYDHWLYEDKDEAGTFQGQPQYWTDRKFSLNDGYALVGLNTIPRAIGNYSPEHSQWRNDPKDENGAVAPITQMISLNSDESIDIMTGTTTVNIQPSGDVTVTTDTNVNVVADTVAIDGDVTVTGSIVADGEVTGNGIALSSHVHAGDGGSGSVADTGPPL